MRNLLQNFSLYNVFQRPFKRYLWVLYLIIIFLAIFFWVNHNQHEKKTKPHPAIPALQAIYKTTTTTTVPVVTTTVAVPQVERTVQVEPTTVPTTLPVPQLTGDKYEWLAQSVIPPEQWVYVDYIISYESGWKPENISPNNCIGLGQNCAWNGKYFLPEACPNWQTDPVCQLNRWDEYATKYGGWEGSYNYWVNNHSW